MAKQANTKAEPLGWAMGRNKWCDQTGMYHLIVNRGDNIARPACGVRMVSGQIDARQSNQIKHGHPCRTCRQIELRLIRS